ncbi:hypothetical protein TARUN_3618 [Trichoderma arundinaceum]|uniref:Uncharacterized protein n=1 Tax=Trichoderma arundinaceum TaxID=490622 RepID=A0A395NRL0_TRIAR|nr:hypothetical protein TARUN_3618 [Trichoderma arundinaceum]
MSQLPVLLIRTGVEDGLSEPISFEPIAHKIESFVNGSHGETAARMTLETAVDFVISLEKREVAAFGPQPDPVASTRDLENGGICGPSSILYEARKLGWGDEPMAGPSSQWAYVENCPKESPYGNLDETMNEAERVARVTATWFEENRPEEPRGIPWRGGEHF